jgi:hypothetical protein
MNMKNLLLLVALPLFVGCFNATEPNNHETKAITVSAGIDTTVPQNAVISLVGTVIHSDFPNPNSFTDGVRSLAKVNQR